MISAPVLLEPGGDRVSLSIRQHVHPELLLVHVAARLRAVLGRPAWRRRWERIGGWMFIALGVGVAATE
ncbi:hypothetical protein ABZX75_24405 [Streptomyces sp. NPDC003038]|uniref:hypothetical protein n=1 Tax=unclassified Streptomyces TaxID=2593676 RepID=UPI0033A52459